MITTCMFVIWYSVHGVSEQFKQSVSCKECVELVAAYIEAGAPEWLTGTTTVPMCIRREEEAWPA